MDFASSREIFSSKQLMPGHQPVFVLPLPPLNQSSSGPSPQSAYAPANPSNPNDLARYRSPPRNPPPPQRGSRRGSLDSSSSQSNFNPHSKNYREPSGRVSSNDSTPRK